MKLIPWILVVLLSIMLMLSWCSRPADYSGSLRRIHYGRWLLTP
jgi:hypothetical protein